MVSAYMSEYLLSTCQGQSAVSSSPEYNPHEDSLDSNFPSVTVTFESSTKLNACRESIGGDHFLTEEPSASASSININATCSSSNIANKFKDLGPLKKDDAVYVKLKEMLDYITFDWFVFEKR